MLLRRYHDAKTVEVKPVEETKTAEKVEAAPEAEETKTRRKRKS